MTRRHVVQVVRSDAFAGVERYIADTATELHRRGWRVSVVGGDPVVMRSELSSDVLHCPAATVGDVVRALWRVGPCDILHAHMTAAELPAALLKHRLGGRLVVTRHFATPRGRSAPGRLAARLIERRLDVQIAISRFVAAATPSPSVVIHNGVRPSAAPEQPRSNVVLVLQRIEPEKDTATALRAWQLSGLGTRGWRLEICGDGSQATELRALSAELGITGSVSFAGFVPAPRERLAHSALLLATATAEPFGLAVVEAMAEGTPVVASEAGAHPETLGGDGRFFPPGDAHRCATALLALADDPAGRVELGNRLRERQRAEFSVCAHVDRLEQVYAS